MALRRERLVLGMSLGRGLLRRACSSPPLARESAACEPVACEFGRMCRCMPLVMPAGGSGPCVGSQTPNSAMSDNRHEVAIAAVAR